MNPNKPIINLSKEKAACQKLWAKNKYFVLSKSNSSYLEIRKYLKQDKVSLIELDNKIQLALSLPDAKGEVINALEHIWGYFKKRATEEEKEEFFELINQYRFDIIEKRHIILFLKELLKKYPNQYLQESNIFD